MNRQAVVPESKEHWLQLRSKNLNSTDVAALFNLSPYTTKFELWHRLKAGEILEIEASERMRWGNRLEKAIALGVGEDKGWPVLEFPEYMYIPELRIGSSFDYRTTYNRMNGIMEIKNVDSLMYRDGWIVDGDHIEAPPHIELQVQHQLLVSGYDYAVICALVGGNRVITTKRTRDEDIISDIQDRAAAFWKSIDLGIQPEINFERDAEAVIKLYQHAEPGSVIDLSEDKELLELAQTYKNISEQIKTLGNSKDAIKAQLLVRINDAEKALGMGFSISAAIRGETEVSYKRAAYRDFRVSFKKKAQMEPEA